MSDQPGTLFCSGQQYVDQVRVADSAWATVADSARSHVQHFTGQPCWPSVNQRNFEIRITARHRTFPEIERTHESRVRLRNDHLEFFSANPTSTTGAKFCPS